MQTNTGFCSLPVEVLANNIFKFFEFQYWLEYLVPVCKKWQLAAVQSQQEKLIRLDLSKPATIFNAQYLVSYYRITALIFKHAGTSAYHLASIVNASPRLKTVTFVPPCTSFTTFTFDNGLLPVVDQGRCNPSICMNHVTTVKVPGQHITLLSMFPNAEQVSICDDVQKFEYSSERVKEIEISKAYSGKWSTLIRRLNKNFPNMKRLYLIVDNLTEDLHNNLLQKGKDLGVEIFFRHWPMGIQNEPSYSTPLLYDNASFPSILEEDPDWTSFDEQSLEKCYYLQTLPFWLSVKFQIEHSENGKELAIETLKNADLQQLVDSFTDRYFTETCAEVLYHLSPQQILQEVGSDKLRIMLNGYNVYTTLYWLITQYEDRLEDFNVDVLELKDLIETKTLQELQSDILDNWGSSSLVDIISIIEQIDIILKEREADGVGTLPTKFIFKLFSQQHFGDIPSLVQLFNIDLNQTYNYKGNTLLSHGIVEGFYSMVLQALTLGIDINKPDKNGVTPLVNAVKQKYQAAVELLLRRGADPNIAGDTAFPLHLALMESDEKSFRIMDTLLTFGADINKPLIDKKGLTIYPISVAMNCAHKNVQSIRQLILRGANLNVTDEVGNTLLHMIRGSDSLNNETFFLLGKHININTANKLGRTPLHHAVMSGSPCVASIIGLGADVNRCDVFGCTPLMMAMKFGCTNETLNPLLASRKVDFKARDKNVQSFVAYLAKHSSWIRIRELLDCEEFVEACGPYLTDDNIQFIIDECKALISEWKDLSNAFKIITCHITLTKFFIEQVGLDVNHSDVLGNTLISCMKVTNDSTDIIEYLIAKGAKLQTEQDPLLLKEVFKVPFFQWKTHQKMILLAKYGAHFTDRNKNGVSLMDVDPDLARNLKEGLHPDYFDFYDLSELPDRE